MPLRRAFRWFSEICGILLGCGVAYNFAENRRAHERIDGLQKSLISRTIEQNNNQTVIVESDRMQSLVNRARKIGWNPNVDGKSDESDAAESSNANTNGRGQ